MPRGTTRSVPGRHVLPGGRQDRRSGPQGGGTVVPTFAKDGAYGRLTVAAFSQWQRVCGFTGDDADGIPGRRSLTQLGQRHGFLVKE